MSGKLSKAGYLLALSGVGLLLNGCVAALVGGAIYHSAKTQEARAEFTTNFQKNNTERERAKLKPLDWCSEIYKFDKDWAKDKAECKERAMLYESGDTTALNL